MAASQETTTVEGAAAESGESKTPGPSATTEGPTTEEGEEGEGDGLSTTTGWSNNMLVIFHRKLQCSV